MADRCGRLGALVMFGCSHVGRTFIDGHSNAALMVAGAVVGAGTLTAAG